MVDITLFDQAGDRDKFEELYATYHKSMYHYACRMLGEYAYLAEDVVQNAFVAIARNMDKIEERNEENVKAYLYITVRSKAYSVLRGEMQATVSLEDVTHLPDAELKEDALNALVEKENYEWIITNIRQLPDLYKEVLELYYVHGFTFKEIAARQNEKYDTIKKRFYRGRTLLIARLKENGKEAKRAENT